MPDGVVGYAYVELRPLMTGFGDATEAELAAGSETGDALSDAGLAAGAVYGDAVGTGASEELGKFKLDSSGLLVPRDFQDAGAAVGAAGGLATGEAFDTAIHDSISSSFAGMAETLPEDASVGLGGLAAFFATKGKQAAEGFGGALSTGLGKLGAVAESAELPFAGALARASTAVDANKGNIDKLASSYAKLGKVVLLAGSALAVGVVYESVKLATGFQQVNYQIAASANISTAAATKISNAFLSTGGVAYASATQIGTAYAKVAGQLGATQGKALTAAQALKFMNTALDLNEAVSGDLATTTGNLSQVMQAFSLKTDQAAYASDVLFNASRLTQTSLGTVTTAVDKLHGRLGTASPSLGDVATLMVELAKNGVVGGKGVQMVSTALTKLLGGSTAVTEQLESLGTKGGTSIASLKQQLDKVNAELDKAGASSPAAANLTSQISALKTQIASFGTVTSSSPAYANVTLLKTNLADLESQLDTTNASMGQSTVGLKDQKASLEAEILALGKTGIQLFNAKGQFIGTTKTLGLLHQAFAVLTPEQRDQAATTLFGAGAAQVMLKVINEGPAAFQKWGKQVAAAGSAAKAAAKNNQTLDKQAAILGSDLEDLGTKLGLKVIPKLTEFVGDLTKGANWLEKNKGAASDAAHALEVTLGGAIALYTGAKFVKFITMIGDATKALGLMSGAEILAGTSGLEGGAGLGAFSAGIQGIAVAAAGVAAFGLTTEALKHTKAGQYDKDLGRDVYNFFGGHAVTPSTSDTAKTNAIVARYGGVAGLEKHNAEVAAEKAKAAAIPRSPMRPGTPKTTTTVKLSGQTIAQQTTRSQASKVKHS